MGASAAFALKSKPYHAAGAVRVSVDPKRDPVAAAKADYRPHLLRLNPSATGEKAYRGSVECYDAELMPLIGVDRQARIVEIGCGFGHLLRYLCEAGFSRVGGVEFDRELHRAAAEYIGASTEFLVCGEGRAFLQEHGDVFDVVILFDVIEHFSPDGAVRMVEAIHASLRAGGLAVVRTPNMSSLLASHSRYIDLTHQTGFTEYSLGQVFRQAGFEQIGVHVPVYVHLRARLRQRLNYAMHRLLYNLQNRVAPASFDANVILWAKKP